MEFMDYTQITQQEEEQMLATIGVSSVDELFEAIPASIRCKEVLDLPPALSELELQRALREMADHNNGAHDMTCFMGAGAYDHFSPVLIDQLVGRGEFLTAYTPYQSEASQGSLQAFFEFQTQVARLAGLDIANASLYDGATAAAEAVLLALNATGKRRVLVADTVHPDTRTVIKSYLGDLPAEYIELPSSDGHVSAETVRSYLDNDTAAVMIQSPNVWGLIEDSKGCFDATHEQDKTIAVAVFNPIASAMLHSPGACGADIATAEGQPLGVPLSFGGPYLGLFAARSTFLRKMPGRIIGQTKDVDGRRCFCLTLQTREQHIRGAKATSNVCTNQGLLALRATMFMSTLGTNGLREMAEQCYHKAHYLANQIAKLPGFRLTFEGPFFNEFCVTCPENVTAIVEAGKRRGILVGVAPSGRRMSSIGNPNQLIIAVTEKRTKKEMDSLVNLFRTFTEGSDKVTS